MTIQQIIWVVSGTVCLFFAIAYNVNYDHKIWLAQRNSNHSYRPHKKGWRLKAVTSIPAVICLAIASDFRWWWAILFSIGISMSLFLLFFDGWSAIKKGEGFWYTGSDDGEEDPESDKFFRDMPLALHIAIKLSLVVGSGFIYIIGLNK